MDIGKELADYKKLAIVEWRIKNRGVYLDPKNPSLPIMNEIRSAAAIKYFSKNNKVLSTMTFRKLTKHYDDIRTILEYL